MHNKIITIYHLHIFYKKHLYIYWFITSYSFMTIKDIFTSRLSGLKSKYKRTLSELEIGKVIGVDISIFLHSWSHQRSDSVRLYLDLRPLSPDVKMPFIVIKEYNVIN